MNGNHVMAAGLPDAVHASQQGFRALLDAMARPGQIRKIGAALPDVPLLSLLSDIPEEEELPNDAAATTGNDDDAGDTTTSDDAAAQPAKPAKARVRK